ncbi:uncharacterized protein LOC119285959 isoform X4 [Triticum dicoccoides]|uniref:uncharacterized protein LOC119285959 isoform X4 n=1 Tax=Triticum dicoccoides TaxID=85692 RepID=UPI00188EE72A|nr:uncharacterized protein LOC119285959 isoform X4 [Triticum dicoccoides]XP_037421193.1 uncharacterized protein LOC119285959 isoform X4 [Triticum dicoccoides]
MEVLSGSTNIIQLACFSWKRNEDVKLKSSPGLTSFLDNCVAKYEGFAHVPKPTRGSLPGLLINQDNHDTSLSERNVEGGSWG